MGVPDDFLSSIPKPTKTYHKTTYDRISPANNSSKGKTIVITGGGTGIGYAIAVAFAQAGAARLILVARSPGPIAEAKSTIEAAHPETKVETIQASMTDAKAMTDLLTNKGDIDVLVLCAAAFAFGPSTKVSVKDVQDSFDTNVVASYQMTQTYISTPALKSGEAKTLINISTASIQLDLPNQVAYGSSKAAFGKLLQYVSQEHTPASGIRIFSQHPGALYTPAAASIMPKDAFPWEVIEIPAWQCVWLAAAKEADALHGKFFWAAWDVDELLAVVKERAGEPAFLTLGVHM